ncbi:MAG TPA: hypothetical protein VFH89_12175 [Sphingomicrobium sp.]|nr:hypothetical protein [Sphingomicrobium sp.]
MRHQELHKSEAFDIVDLAEVWPERAAELEGKIDVNGAPAVPDLPGAAGVMIVGVYTALMGAFAITLAHEGHAAFAIGIGAFFVAMFFAVPLVFLRLEKDKSRRPTLTAFLETGIETATGHLSGAGALVQMLIVPLLLAFAILAIGVINLLI